MIPKNLRRRPRIALIVDQPQRDLAGLVLTSVELSRRGAICYLVPANLRDPELWALAPDFVLFYCMRRGYEQLAHQLESAGIQFGLLDAEGGVWPDYESYAELLWDDAALFNMVSCVCAWGPNMAGFLVRKGLFSEKQVVVTGCPRFDLYDPMWRPVLQEKQLKNDNRKDKRILINTNSTEANPRFASAEVIKKHFCDIFGWSSSRLKEWIETQNKTIEMTISLARDLARDYPESNIVLRPHPFEGAELYRKRLSDLSNVEINDSGPVQTQIFKAATVIQRSCTTAIEAGLASVPTFSPQWVPTPAVMQMAEDVSVPCNTYAELRANLDSVFSKQYHSPEKTQGAINEVVRDWFYQMDGLSYKRVSDTVLSRINDKRCVNEDVCTKYLYGLDGLERGAIAQLSRRVRYGLRLAPNWSFQKMRPMPAVEWTETDQYFDIAEVRELATRVSQQFNGQVAPYQTMSVDYAQERGDYLHNYIGYSITISGKA